MSKNRKQRKLTKIKRNLKKDELQVSELPYNEYINFNFQFLSDQDGLPIEKISSRQLKFIKDLLKNLKEYSVKTLQTCINEGIYVNYGEFPKQSNFTKPKERKIHKDVLWGRFRFGGINRLCGFVLPKQDFTKGIIFFVVYLDPDHNFYPTQN